MSDNERTELSERVAVLEALLHKHEEGALIRKAEISKSLEKINDTLATHRCSEHALNMINFRGELTQIKDKDIQKVNDRLSLLEKTMWTGLGGLSVLMAFLKWIIK